MDIRAILNPIFFIHLEFGRTIIPENVEEFAVSLENNNLEEMVQDNLNMFCSRNMKLQAERMVNRYRGTTQD